MSETETGLHSLVDPPCEEELLLNILTSCLKQHLENADKRPIDECMFLDCTNKFLQCMKTQCSQNKSYHNTATVWAPCLRSLLVVVSETLFVSCSSQVCKKAVDDVMVVPPTVKHQLLDLLVRLMEIQKMVLCLQNEMHQILKSADSKDFPHNSSMSVVWQSHHVLGMLEGCQAMLAVVVEGVEKKATFEVRFFNTASATAGLFSAGRLAWSMWTGESVEEVVKAGIWSVCVGFSAAVLQIPRIRVTDIVTQLRRLREHRKQTRHLTQGWDNYMDWSYAKFVRLPSPRNAISL